MDDRKKMREDFKKLISTSTAEIKMKLLEFIYTEDSKTEEGIHPCQIEDIDNICQFWGNLIAGTFDEVHRVFEDVCDMEDGDTDLDCSRHG